MGPGAIPSDRLDHAWIAGTWVLLHRRADELDRGRGVARFGRIDEWHVELHNNFCQLHLGQIPGRSHKINLHVNI